MSGNAYWFVEPEWWQPAFARMGTFEPRARRRRSSRRHSSRWSGPSCSRWIRRKYPEPWANRTWANRTWSDRTWSDSNRSSGNKPWLAGSMPAWFPRVAGRRVPCAGIGSRSTWEPRTSSAPARPTRSRTQSRKPSELCRRSAQRRCRPQRKKWEVPARLPWVASPRFPDREPEPGWARSSMPASAPPGSAIASQSIAWCNSFKCDCGSLKRSSASCVGPASLYDTRTCPANQGPAR